MEMPTQNRYLNSRALSGPAILATRFAIIYVCVDAAVFLGAALCVRATLGRHSGEFAPQAFGLVLWWVFVFQLLGNYRRSYAVFPRDEFYYTAVGAIFAFAPLALVATLYRHQWFLPHLTLTMIFAFVFCGLARACLFNVRQTNDDEKESAEFRVTGPPLATRFFKRIVDIVLGVLGSVIFLPFMLVAALSIYVESGFPIFFRQERVGKGGRSFQILKFRTMHPNAGGHWARPGDERITPLGSILRRLSIDEMPQIINVLRGEMSIVGPRPEWRTFAEQFAVTLPHYNDRHLVSPGITGWGQVYMNRNLTPSDAPVVLSHDLFYVSHCSMYLDFSIILKTGVEFLFHRAV